VNYGFQPSNLYLVGAFCHFLLAQKVTKKGTLPNASTLKLTRSSLGKEASPPFFY